MYFTDTVMNLGLLTPYTHPAGDDLIYFSRDRSLDLRADRYLGMIRHETGLAAGDHLHYGVYLDGVAILPVEWWDAKWIEDNITPKLEGRSGQEIAQAQQGKGPRKAKHKSRIP